MKGRPVPLRPALFGTFRVTPVRCRRMALVAALAATCGTSEALAATIPLTANDAINTTSFNAAGHWSNNAAPSAANDYTVAAAYNLRTPAAAGNFTFAGNSLTLGDSSNYGTLLYKGTGPATDIITVNNLNTFNAQINNGNAGSTFTLAGTLITTGAVAFGTSGDNNGTVGRTIIVSSSMSGAGKVSVTSTLPPNGSAVFSGTNTYTGGTTLGVNATLRVTQSASLPTQSDGTFYPVTLGNNATLSLFVGGTGEFTASDLDRVRNGITFGTNNFLGLDTTDAPAGFTYSNNLSGSFGFAKTGANTLYLTGSNTYTGGTNLFGGNLNFANIGNLGTGPIIFNGGFLQFAAGNTTDITSVATVNLTGGGGVDSNGNDLTFSGALNGTGIFTKTGAGTLTLLSTSTPANFFVRQGQAVLTGASASLTTSGYCSIGQVNADNGTLTVKNGAKLTIGTDFNISDVSQSAGNLFIADDTGSNPPTVKAATLYVGKSGTDSGAVVQTAGTVQSAGTSGDWRIGGTAATDPNAVGTYDLSGGTFTTTSNFQPGVYGIGQMTISGSASASVGGYPSIGRFVGSKGVLNVLGGTFTQSSTANTIIVGESGTGILNVSGTGIVNASNGPQLRIGNLTSAASPGVGIVNLGSGGTILAKSVNTAGTTATSVFNFHGGTLAPTVASTTFMTGLSAAFVYAEGAQINTNGVDITIGQPLLAPADNGVIYIPLNSGGSGYVANPVVLVSGAGVGASAIPVLSGGTLSGVNVVNPGFGYTSAPTVTITGGNPTTAAVPGTPSVGSNASGALTKLGTGTLTLTGANTYAGGTIVSAGRLAVGATNALGSAGNVILTAGTTLDTSALGATGFTLDAGRTLLSNAATVTGQLNVSGTYQGTGANTLGGLTVNGGGLVSEAGGTLTLGGAVTNNGTIRLTGGGTLAASGASSFVNNGVIDLLDGTAQFPANFSNGSNGVVLTQSSVRVSSVSKTAAGGVTVTISSVSGFSYQLQRSATLVGANYANVGAAQAGSNGTTLTFTDSAPTGTQAFYRVTLSR